MRLIYFNGKIKMMQGKYENFSNKDPVKLAFIQGNPLPENQSFQLLGGLVFRKGERDA
jgi:hypothetical protein